MLQGRFPLQLLLYFPTKSSLGPPSVFRNNWYIRPEKECAPGSLGGMLQLWKYFQIRSTFKRKPSKYNSNQVVNFDLLENVNFENI